MAITIEVVIITEATPNSELIKTPRKSETYSLKKIVSLTKTKEVQKRATKEKDNLLKKDPINLGDISIDSYDIFLDRI